MQAIPQYPLADDLMWLFYRAKSWNELALLASRGAGQPRDRQPDVQRWSLTIWELKPSTAIEVAQITERAAADPHTAGVIGTERVAELRRIAEELRQSASQLSAWEEYDSHDWGYDFEQNVNLSEIQPGWTLQASQSLGWLSGKANQVMRILKQAWSF